jgi:hypothetical protein
MIYRTSKDKDHPYVMLNKTFLHDQNLSLKAKGLLAYCMSMPDGWEFHISQMQTVLKEGRDALNSAFKELMKFGYCQRLQNKNEKGQFDSGEYLLYEIPINIKKEEKPQTENPFTVKATSENPPLVINKENKKDINIKEFGSFVKFSQDQYEALCTTHTKQKVDEIIQSINDYCTNSRPKGYKDYEAAFRTFLKNYKPNTSNPKQSNKEFVSSKFKHGEKYNGAECFINDEGIAFQRNMHHKSVRFKEYGFKDQFENMLREFGI